MAEMITNDQMLEAAQEIWDGINANEPHVNQAITYALSYVQALIDGSVQKRFEVAKASGLYNGSLEDAYTEQCEYILSNLSMWRHPKANDLRATLRAYATYHVIARHRARV